MTIQDRAAMLRLFTLSTATLAVLFAVGAAVAGAPYVAGGLVVFAALATALGLRASALSPSVGGGLFVALWVLALAVAIPWTGGGVSPALPLLIPTPVAATFLAGKRGGALTFLAVASLMLGSLSLASAGVFPSSVLGPLAGRWLLFAALLTSVVIAMGFGVLYDGTWRRQTEDERRRAEALRDVTRTMSTAAAGLGRAADVFRSQAGPDTLVGAMDRAAREGRQSAAAARERLHGFLDRQDVLTANAEAIEARRASLQTPIQHLHHVAEQLDLVALDVSILAASEGEAGRAFGALAGRTRGLVTRLGDVAAATRATLGGIAAVQAQASAKTADAQQTARTAAAALEGLVSSFEAVFSLVEQASLTGRELAQSAVDHVDQLSEAAKAARGGADGEALRDAIIGRLLPWLVAGAAFPVVVMGVALTLALDHSPGPLLLALGLVTASPLLGLRWGLGLRLNSHLFVLASNLLLAVVSWGVGGGLTAPALSGLAITPLAAIFLLGRRAGLRWALVALALDVALGGADLAGLARELQLSGEALSVLRFVPTIIFSGLAFGFGTGFASVLGTILQRVSAERRRLRDLLGGLRAAGRGVRELAEAIAGADQGPETLAEAMRTEAARGTRLSGQTRAAFQELVDRTGQAVAAAEAVVVRATRVNDLVGDVSALSSELDLTASRVAMTAVQATQDASAFEVLGGEMASLAVTLRRDTERVREALVVLREAVHTARADGQESLQQTRRAAAELDELAVSFDAVCALIDRAAEASNALAAEVLEQFALLERGLQGDLQPDAEGA